MCRILGVTRAEIYRPHLPRPASLEAQDVRREVTEVASEMPCYGYRRIVEEVSRRRATRVNHKQVRRVMREEKLVCRRPKRFRVTTDFAPRLCGVSESRGRDEADKHQSTMGCGHHLRAVAERLLLLGCHT